MFALWKHYYKKIYFPIDRHTNTHSLMAMVCSVTIPQSNKGSQRRVGYKLPSPTHEMHCFILEVPGATLSGDLGYFIWLPGRGFTLAERDRLSVRNAAGPREKGENAAQHSTLLTDYLLLNKALYLLNPRSCTQHWAWARLWGRCWTSGTCYCTPSMSWTTWSFPGGFHQYRKTCFRWCQPHEWYAEMFYSGDLWFILFFCVLFLQLGGDFLLDEHGRVLFSHRCQSPIDRPSVRDILSTLSATVD